ncbi:PAS domain-containing protein [Kiloniella laminariae]|uniref:PAS domain-containing protein n=1 Tax=Kiloniella laminariae TaxID=454162 RepID=A0ABT4LNE6_9PROT|nr:PAS domain-containing protein [Kiloniella laminariae]MCZ4281472.1 PAS domain-containing protein [Kiloniella laminariae]
MTNPMRFNARIFDESFLDQCDERISAFYLMWKAKCKEGRIPARSDFDPLDMVKFLPGITLVDVERDTLELTYRLVGTNEVAVRGNDPTGKKVKDTFLANNWEDVWGNYSHVIKNKGVAFDDSDMPNSNGVMVGDETIFVPLSQDGEFVNMVMLYSIQRKAAG